MTGRSLFLLEVSAAARRQVLLRALAMGLEHGTDGLGGLLLLAPTDDPAQLGDLARELAALDGVESIACCRAQATAA